MKTIFSKQAVKKWEKRDGVDFVVALSRITNWLIHVEWISPSANTNGLSEKNMIPLRAYVANNSNLIFDFTGIYTIEKYYDKIICPLGKKRNRFQSGGYLSRYYSEEDFFKLPLKFKPDEILIEKAYNSIKRNKLFLDRIPKRNDPLVPADIAAKFTFGYCNPFAETIYEEKGYEPVAIIANEYNELFSGSKLGYVHSFNKINNSIGLDIWGEDTIENILKRFGVTRCELSESEHIAINKTLKKNSPKKYEELSKESIEIVNKYFENY